MAIMDNALLFSNAQSLAVTTSTASTNVIDLTGAGAGTAPSMSHGNSSVFGADMGVGNDGVAVPKVQITLGTTLATTNSATLNIAFQGAPDNGSNQPGTWTTYVETGAIAASNLTAGQKIVLDYPVRAIGAAMPRFIRLFYQLPAATTFTTGAATAAIVLSAGSEFTTGQYPSNFVAGA